MTTNPVDEYLGALDEPAQSTLRALRSTLVDLMPDAEEGLAYGVPAFRVDGKVVAGFAAFQHHLSYFPHSGDVLEQLGDAVAGYTTSKGTLKFGLAEPLPLPLVERLVRARLHEIARARSRG